MSMIGFMRNVISEAVGTIPTEGLLICMITINIDFNNVLQFAASFLMFATAYLEYKTEKMRK